MSTTNNNTALIFGASGITGWALLRECLIYPSPTTFSRIIGLTNRPLKREDMLLPTDQATHSDRWQLYAGMDLSRGVDVATEKLGSVEGIGEVTHVFFAGMGFHIYTLPC